MMPKLTEEQRKQPQAAVEELQKYAEEQINNPPPSRTVFLADLTEEEKAFWYPYLKGTKFEADVAPKK